MEEEDIHQETGAEETKGEGHVLRKVDVELSPKYGVPKCYVQFFNNKKHNDKQPKEEKETKEGEDNDEEESQSDDEEIIQSHKKGKGDDEKPNVIVIVKQRSKRKNTTTIANLEPWGVDIKEFSKHIAKKNGNWMFNNKDSYWSTNSNSR